MRILLAGLALLCLVGGVFGYAEATRDPTIRRAQVALPDWPAGVPSVRLLLMSDLHVQGPDMPPRRLSAIVAAANGLQPDLVVLAGDFLGNKIVATRNYGVADAVAPLGKLSAPLGVYAVLGNNDQKKGLAEVSTALARAGISVIDNDALEAGPIALGGVRTRLGKTLARLRSLPGAKVMVAHSPDAFAELPSDVSLMLAGHTHCGQIVLPLLGAIATGSRFGNRYLCGLVREKGKLLVVTAGLGTSRLPIRIGAPPDLWLLEIGGSARARQAHEDGSAR